MCLLVLCYELLETRSPFFSFKMTTSIAYEYQDFSCSNFKSTINNKPLLYQNGWISSKALWQFNDMQLELNSLAQSDKKNSLQSQNCHVIWNLLMFIDLCRVIISLKTICASYCFLLFTVVLSHQTEDAIWTLCLPDYPSSRYMTFSPHRTNSISVIESKKIIQSTFTNLILRVKFHIYTHY